MSGSGEMENLSQKPGFWVLKVTSTGIAGERPNPFNTTQSNEQAGYEPVVVRSQRWVSPYPDRASECYGFSQ